MFEEDLLDPAENLGVSATHSKSANNTTLEAFVSDLTNYGPGGFAAEMFKDDEEEEEEQPKVSRYTWFCLVIIFMIQLGNQWQRFTMSYAFGFNGKDYKDDNPFYELRTAIPEMAVYYGLLSGVIFLLPFSILGIFTGRLVDIVPSRKLMFGLVSILWSTTTLVQALFPNIYVFIIMRFFLGVFESTGNPLMYSLLRDLFPPNQRSTATSIVGSTISLGAAISSLSILMINNFGWQVNYYVTAAYGITVGIVAILFMKEPERGAFDKKKEKPKLQKLKTTIKRKP